MATTDTSTMFTVLAAFIGIYLIFLLVMLAIYVVEYIFMAIGLSGVAKNLGIRNAWLAWIPFTSVWVLGRASDEAHERNTAVKGNCTKWLMIMMGSTLAVALVSIVLSVFSAFPLDEELLLLVALLQLVVSIVNLVIAIPYAVVTYVCYYRIYKLCYPNQAVLFLLLSIFVSVTAPFLLFACRNKVPAFEDNFAEYVVEA